ncbi:beta-propeller fold lactonase family protein [Microbacterium betulae]|uniref:Beta-propeller fold lactonase family protein n=1 Tax=Microbacterium betulae TaxID=2981139 RepID=A0AA97FGV3_9MICO|nr:beta-propeller fold lactonase family protein [Microbacterium sp. AB]WOF23201.1 beta-propeller fold lactonase family protein [Microbacterium sp. AB]
MRFWVGGWGPAQGGESEGVSLVTAGEAESPLAGGVLADRGLAAPTESASWLAAHPAHDVVYAALEADGRLTAFSRTGEASLAPLGETIEAGAAVCHIAVAADGSHLIASCWGDGRVVHVPLRSDGSLGNPALGDAAADPYAAAPEPDLGDALAGEGEVDVRDLLGRGAEPADIAALLADAGGASAPSDWSGAMDLRALVDGDADPAVLAALLAGGDGGSAEADLRALLGQVKGDPFDDPAVRGILDAARRPSDIGDVLREAAPSAPAEPRPSRAHSAAFLPGGRVATTDLGLDLVRIWRTSARGLVLDHEVVLPFGTGPRHTVRHPSGFLYVLTEFSGEVFVLAQGPDGRWALRGGMRASGASLDGDTGAELARSRDGEFLYAGLRGSDTIAVLRVRGDGGTLDGVALVEAGAAVPRHHVVGRDALLVAGQGSDEIVSLPLDARTGVPARPRHRLAVPTPTHLLPTR